MDSKQNTNSRKDQNTIRHFKGTVKQFKDMFDDLADGEDTNAYDSPVRQGFDVHPTRDKDNTSPHWDKDYEDEKTQNENHIPTFSTFLNEGRADGGKMAKTHVVYALRIQEPDGAYLASYRVAVKKGPKAEERAKKLAKKDLGKNLGSIKGISKALNPELHNVAE